MLSSTYYDINDVMCRSLYDVNVYDLILSLIEKKNPLHIDLQLVLCVSRQNFHSEISKEHVPCNLLEVHHPRKFLYHYVRYISYPILALILHKPYHHKYEP